MPTGKLAISGFRVFGKGAGKIPEAVQNFVVLRYHHPAEPETASYLG